eukprot:CAMPEP_0167793488 /NCGR_PEP_ID=MMETSP0111_2-20121227/13220_1 /TAXON_ID=91324 /ORGANISM="Lotharella globosa, Strain CCCM811" /LENGTH=400 /DNA_ID=CAMNT_0007686675 /DNA_START=26 /DNA_END=1228 /DNA_ORIENTATION=-
MGSLAEDIDGKSVPVIDFSQKDEKVAKAIDRALRTWGAFVCTGHGVDDELSEAVFAEGKKFFEQVSEETKQKLHIRHNGARWRGYMPIGGERSHGGKTRDLKAGLYLGEDHAADHPYVKQGLPLWGGNVLPDKELPNMRELFNAYIKQVKQLGDRTMDLISIGLGLPEKTIQDRITENDAISIVRMWYYPPQGSVPHAEVKQGEGTKGKQKTEGVSKHVAEKEWGIGAHSDYGLWTIIRTDAEGLEFQHPEYGWSKVPFIKNSFVMNAGDVLDRLTGGRYKSRFHRAMNHSSKHPRMSMPFFYDPSWEAKMMTLPILSTTVPTDETTESRNARWGKTKITCDFDGKVRYKEFLAKKVANVFPDLVPKELLVNLKSTSAPSTRHAIAVPVTTKQEKASEDK